MGNTKQRNYSIEFLRLFFMILIVVQHYLVHGLEYNSNSFLNIHQSGEYLLHMSLMGISMLGVSGFMFISGYYSITFRFSRLKSLWFQSAFYFLVLTVGIYLITGRGLGKAAFFYMPFGHSNWWYLLNYVIVFLIAPILNAGIKAISKYDLRTVIILFFGLLYIDKFLAFNYGTELPLLIFIYLWGRYVKLYGLGITDKNLKTIFFIGSSLLLAVPVALGIIGKPVFLRLFFSNYNPLILFTSTAFVLLIAHIRINSIPPIIASLLSNTLAIYLITDYRPVRNWLAESVIKGSDYSILYVILIIMGVCICCLIVEEIRKALMGRLTNARIKRIEGFISGNHSKESENPL